MKYLKPIITVIIAVLLITGCYYYFTHRETKTADDDVDVTELDKVLARQLDSNYPETPRGVVLFYNRIIECAYGGGYSEEQFELLIGQARMLMDEELLENNPLDTYKLQFQEEIAQYKEKSQKIIRTGVCDSEEVEYEEINGEECAYVTATYFIKTGKNHFTRTYESYLLRKDGKSNWKIVAYHLTSSDDIDENEV